MTMWSWKKALLVSKILVLASLLTLCLRTYYLYQTFQAMPTYRESIDFMLQHKTTFLILYKLKPWQEKINDYFYPPKLTRKGKPVKKPVSERLANWLEARIMHHIERNDNIRTFQDLPRLERMVLRSLDGSSYASKMSQQTLYYLTNDKSYFGRFLNCFRWSR